MKQYEFKLIFLDRVDLRDEGSKALASLNVLGNDGWRIVHIREDVQHERALAIFLERERAA